MKQKLLKTMLLLCALVVGTSMSWADTKVSWTRVTSIQTLRDGGTFIMGYEATANSGVIVPLRTDATAATTSANGILYSGTGTGTTSNNSTINMSSVTETANYELYITASSVTNAINMQLGSNSGNYIGCPNSKNTAKLYSSASENTAYTLTVGSNDVFTLECKAADTGSKYKYLKFNNNSGSYRYANYSTAPEKIVFYKKVITHTLTYSATNGSIEGEDAESNTVASGADVEEGATVELTANPSSGYSFIGWSVSGTGSTLSNTSTNPTTFTMGTADATVTATFVSASACAEPSFTIDEGTYNEAQSVEIECPTDGATIYYTTDGTDPTTKSFVYSSAIDVNATTTIKAFAAKSGLTSSSIVSATYTLKCATPTITIPGAFIETKSVTMSSSAGATIRYTTDGSTTPTQSEGTLYDPAAKPSISATTTIKAIAYKDGWSDSDVATETFTKIVPKTVAEALTAIAKLDDGGTIDDQCVNGIVSTAATSISSGKMTYSISADGTTTDELQIYQGKGLNNANFSDVTDLEVGDRVVVYGQLKKYVKDATTTPEFNSGSYLLSLVEIQDNDLTKTGDINLSMASPSTTADATEHFTTSSAGTISYESGNTGVATVSAAGVVTPVAAGSTTITVTQAKTADYKAGEITINVTVSAASLNETEIAANTSGNTAYGTPKVEDYMISDTYDGTIAAVSSNTAVATVAITQHTDGEGTFTVTPVAVGSAVITISAPATATCEAAEDVEYTITVTAPVGGTTAAPAPTNIFEERFSTAAGTGPSGASWSGSIAGSTFASDNSGWSSSYKYSGDGCARFGNGSNNGAATTPTISFDPSVTYTLTFKAGAWNGDGTTLTLSCDDATAVLGKTSFTMKQNAWTEYETTVKAKSGSKLTFTTSSKRFFLDDVVISSGVSLKATLNASGYATYCSEYPLDFSGASDYTAWQITDISSSNVITFAKVTGSVKGGTGLLLKGTADETITLTSANSTNTLDDNMFEGTLAPTYVAANKYYGLSGANFVKINAGTVKAGKAILDADYVTEASVKAFTFVFEDDATGIRTVETVSAEEAAKIFNLSGQRINKLQKGINIVNGKKVLY